jgi:hypothetical protein
VDHERRVGSLSVVEYATFVIAIHVPRFIFRRLRAKISEYLNPGLILFLIVYQEALTE